MGVHGVQQLACQDLLANDRLTPMVLPRLQSEGTRETKYLGTHIDQNLMHLRESQIVADFKTDRPDPWYAGVNGSMDFRAC